MSSFGTEDSGLVSVIMPVYNAAPTVVLAINSVVLQSYPHWQLFIIDDGSTDSSGQVVQKFIASQSDDLQKKIFYTRKKNEGPSKARNLGIEKSSGPYIAFLDSDDFWTENKLEIQVKYAQENPDIGIVSGGFNRSIIRTNDKFVLISFGQLLHRNYFNTPTVLLRREKLGKQRFLEEQKYSEDYRLWLDITFLSSGLYINQTIAKSITGKFDYGDSGLSSNLWQMQKGELSNYYYLMNTHKISTAQFLYSSIFSLIKYFRRILIIAFKSYGV